MEPEDSLANACYVVLHIQTVPLFLSLDGGSTLVVRDGERFSLSDEIWIERLDEQLAINVQRACEPPHYGIDGVNYDRHLYAFVMRVPAKQSRRFEGMETLLSVLALSRLIHPTSIGQRYCAHVLKFGLEESAIYAIQYRGMNPDVFLSKSPRDWLSVEDCENLRALMRWLEPGKKMHDRVHRAYWYHEYVMRSSVLDIRFPLVATGLEALINTSEQESGKQFYSRIPQLAQACGVPLSEEEAKSAWKLRSKLAHAEAFLHGMGIVLPDSEHNGLYEKLETVLRSTVRKCLLDEPFGDTFSDQDSVNRNWPLSLRPTAKAFRKKGTVPQAKSSGRP